MGYLINYSNWRKLYEAANGELPPEILAPVTSQSGSFKLNKAAAADYNAMVAAAKEDGISWNIGNSYRTIKTQFALVKQKGLYSQGGLAAAPGTSLHGWGAALDLDVEPGKPSHTWLVKNAARFGFSTIPREPWHWEHRASAKELLKTKTPNSTTLASTTDTTPTAISNTFDDIKNRVIAIRSGMTGDIISKIQAKLKELGLLTKEPNGSYDSDTEAAIRKFQENNSLVVDGVFGHKTYSKMFEPNAQVALSASQIDKKQVYNYLKTKMDDTHALGILANIQAESNFNSAAIGDSGTSGGLFQHHATRFSALKSVLGENTWSTNWKGQIDFALSEQPGIQYLSKSFNTPEEASEWWVRVFERPANVNRQVLIRNANVAQVKQALQANGVQFA